MQKRIGNDFTVTLNITRKGSPEDFTNAFGITVVLQHMTCSFIRLTPNQITVNGSKISFPVTADQQKEPGKYRVLVKYHKTALDGLKTYTVDKCDIFELVSDDCGIDATDTDVVADIDIKIEQDGKDGLSAYELDVLINNYQGTLEEWLDEVHSGTGGNVDLSDYYTKEEVNKELENKVTTEAGKGLSSNDYTNEEKEKLELLVPVDTYGKQEIDAKIEEARISLNLTDEQLSKLNVNLIPILNELKEVNLFSVKGKNMVTLGDSSTSSGGTMTNIKTGNWVSFVCNKLGLGNLSRNIAVGSATWKDWYDGEYSDDYTENLGQNTISSQIYRLIKYCLDKKGTSEEFMPHFIFIQAAGNDLPYGTFPYDKWDTYFGDFDKIMYGTTLSDVDYNPIDTSTPEGQNLHIKLRTFRSNMWGAMRWAIETLLTHFPNSTIFIGSPLQRGNEKNRNIFELRDGMRRMAEFYNCPFIDCTSLAGMTWFTENRKTNGWSDNWYTYDQTHKGDLGNTLVGNFISAQIKMLYFEKPPITATKQELIKYTVTTSYVEGSDNTQGDIVPLGNSIVSQGSSLNISITAKSGYEIEDVAVNGVSNGAISSYTFENIQANGTLQAKFKVRVIPANPPVLNGITIDKGASVVDHSGVPIWFDLSGGTPTHYKIANSESLLSSTSWKAYHASIGYDLSEGLNTLFAIVRNADGESSVKSASVTYTPASSGGDTWISKLAFGDYYVNEIKDNITFIMSNVDSKVGVSQNIYDTSGNKVGTAKVVVRGSGTSGGKGNSTGNNSGLFADDILIQNTQWSNTIHQSGVPTQLDIIVPSGNYKFKIFGNTKIVISDITKCLYSVNGVVMPPKVTPTNNYTEFLCEFEVAVNGTVEVKILGDIGVAKTVPLNVLEIEKIS